MTIPVPTPVTSPPELTVATVGVPLVQDPPAGQPVSVMLLPVHKLVPPVMILAGLTVKAAVA